MTENKKIFAYGSLMNESSLRKTVPTACNVFPARVYGFKRVFDLASHYRYCSEQKAPVCVLNLVERTKDISINGICFDMDDRSFNALLSREQIYQLHRVKVFDYRDDNVEFSANLFWAKDYQPYQYLRGSEAQRHYLDLCLSGCSVYGEDFVQEFKATTSFWGLGSNIDSSDIWGGDY